MADKTKTIKDATDKELDALIIRLRKESEAQSIISCIKRNSTPKNNNVGYDSYNSVDDSVSTEAPIESMYHNDEVEETLKHFGILGMKWGRKSASKPGTTHVPEQTHNSETASKKKPTNSDDYEIARTLKKKNPKTMTNKELKDLNARLQLEKSYRELKSADMQKGIDSVKSIVSTGKTITGIYDTVHEVASSPMTKAIIKALKKSPPTP